MDPNLFIVLQWLPTTLVLIVGLVLSIVNRRKLRAATGFAIAGFGVIIAGYLVSMVFSLNQGDIYNSLDSAGATNILYAVWIALALWEALGIGLLTVGMIVGRNAPDKPSPPPYSQPYGVSPQPFAQPYGAPQQPAAQTFVQPYGPGPAPQFPPLTAPPTAGYGTEPPTTTTFTSPT